MYESRPVADASAAERRGRRLRSVAGDLRQARSDGEPAHSGAPRVPLSLSELGTRRRYPAGATLIAQDSHADRLIAIVHGFVTEEHLARDGRRTVHHLRGPGEMLGDLGLLGSQQARTSAVALTDVTALCVPCAAVRCHLQARDPLMLQVLDHLALRERASERSLIDVGHASADVRVSRRVLELAERWGRPHPRGVAIPVPLRQRDLAAWATVSQQAATKCLSALRARGIVETGRRSLLVRDMDALRERCAR